MINSFVYVIGPAAETAPVKIGFTSNPVDARLAALSTGSPVPLTVIAAMRATEEMERKLHKFCHEYRLHGEWFERKGPVIDVIIYMMTDPDYLNPMLNKTKWAYWIPDEVDACPASLAIWTELSKIGVPMREWAELYDRPRAKPSADPGTPVASPPMSWLWQQLEAVPEAS